MRANTSQLPLLLKAGDSSVRGTNWDGLRVSVISVPAGTDFSPLLKGLPDDLCPGAHWGYVIKGALRVCHSGGEELLRAGDVYYMPPGHTGIAEEDTEFIEIVDPEKQEQFLTVARKNVAEMEAPALY